MFANALLPPKEQIMSASDTLLKPEDCVLVLVDFQAGLAFGVESIARQTVLNNAVALARTAIAFGIPVVVSTSASRVYSGSLLPALEEVLAGTEPIERRSMNLWEDEAVRAAILKTGKKRLIVAGLLTEACVSFPVLSALSDGFEVFVIGDACGGLSAIGHDLALRRMEAAGAQLSSWIQILLEFQRDWTRHESYEAARSIVVANGGGYGMGLAYAREMIHPG
jgi:nicotinamidase-related amidase